MFESFSFPMCGRNGMVDLCFHGCPVQIDPAGLFQYGDAGQQRPGEQRGHSQKSPGCPADEKTCEVAAPNACHGRR